MLADSDHVGISTLVEYAMGLSVLQYNGADALPDSTLSMVNGVPYMSFTHRRSKINSVNYNYRSAPDLSTPSTTWPSAEVIPEVVNSDLDGDGRVELVSVQIPFNRAANDSLFVVMEVSLP